MTGTPEAGPGRTRRAAAAATLRCGPEELPARLCRFAGLCQPGGPAATAMLDGLCERLCEVPFGEMVTTGDLTDAVTRPPTVELEPIPAIPDSILSAARWLSDLLTTLSPGELRGLAGEAGLEQTTALCGALRVLAEREHPARPPAGVVEPFGDPADEPPAADPGRQAAQLIATLTDRDPACWGELALAATRRGMARHLAAAGDAFLRTSEAHPTRRHWWPGSTAETGSVRLPIPGAPAPLEAHLAPPPRAEEPSVCLFDAACRAPGRSVHWEVGWRDATGSFYAHTTGWENSPPAARFAAEVCLDGLAGDPARVRMRLSGELLVPRPRDVRSLDARLVTCEDLLVAVLSEHHMQQQRAEGGLWRVCPHRTGAGEIGSLLAALFDQLCLPCPQHGERANTAAVDDPAFTSFLSGQAITLTPAARAYLAGLADPGPDGHPLAERHAAGLRAVLTQDDAEISRLATELPTRRGLTPRHLQDLAALKPYLTPEDH